MRVRVISRSAFHGASGIQKKLIAGLTHGNNEDGLLVGQEHIVYGIEIVAGVLRYIILDDDTYVHGPTGHLANCFEVVDPRMSRHWVIHSVKSMAFGSWTTICYPEWRHDTDYLERLYDDEPDAIQNWLTWKAVLDEEFLD